MDVETLRAMWEAGQTAPAARAIYDSLPIRRRAGWAADVLDLACSRLPSVPAPVRAVVELGRAGRLGAAHTAFSAVRHLTLSADRGGDSGTYVAVLGIAEDAAKVMYNSSGVEEPVPEGVKAPFDEECGYALAGGLAHLARSSGSPDFDRAAWAVHESWLTRPWWRFW